MNKTETTPLRTELLQHIERHRSWMQAAIAANPHHPLTLRAKATVVMWTQLERFVHSSTLVDGEFTEEFDRRLHAIQVFMSDRLAVPLFDEAPGYA